MNTYCMRRGTAVNVCLLDCSKEFDKCRFVKLFNRGFSPIVVRVLVFSYEEQKSLNIVIKHVFICSNPYTAPAIQGSGHFGSAWLEQKLLA